MKKLMILGAGLLQLPAIKKAKQMGLEVLVADMNPGAVGFEEEGLSKLLISTTDTDKVLRAAREHGIDGILTVASDVPIPTVAKVCEELGLPGVSCETARYATNKADMRKRLQAAEIPVPAFGAAKDLKSFLEIARDFKDKKVVVKSSDSSGNRGVSMVKNASDIDMLSQAFEYAKLHTRDGRVVIEEYMSGPEFSVEGMSINGKYFPVQVTDKITSGPPYFVEMGHTQPSAQPEAIVNAIKNAAEKGVLALGINNGPSHTEIILTSEGPKIVEIGARLGGGCITSHLVPLSTGVDMIEANINVALGNPIEIEPKFHKGAAIRFFNSHAGVLTGIKGVEKALTDNGVKEVGFFSKIGDQVNELKTGLDRIGYVIAQGETRDEAIENCAQAMDEITLTIE